MTRLDPIDCDQCHHVRECRFEYIDPHQGNYPMLFCSIECLTQYVVKLDLASSHLAGKRSRELN